MKLKHFNTFLQFRLLFHDPHCTLTGNVLYSKDNGTFILWKSAFWAAALKRPMTSAFTHRGNFSLFSSSSSVPPLKAQILASRLKSQL